MENSVEIINYLVVDVDGTLTDAGIYYDNNGNEIKKFLQEILLDFMLQKQLESKLLF